MSAGRLHRERSASRRGNEVPAFDGLAHVILVKAVEVDGNIFSDISLVGRRSAVKSEYPDILCFISGA